MFLYLSVGLLARGAPRFVNINKTNKNLIEQVETLKYFILELDNEREFLRFQLS